MPFTIINGHYAPALGHPDGDSVRFIPDNPDPLFKLARQGLGPKINPDNGSIQLRYEAIDAMEKNAAPPWQMRARERNLAILGTSLGGSPAPGHILSRQLDSHGRPICFAFAGANTAASVRVMAITAKLISRTPLMAAEKGSRPSSMCR
jgi:hypothetical protein